jgi:hypothetical protein
VANDELCENTITSKTLKINVSSLPTAEITAPKITFCDEEKPLLLLKPTAYFSMAKGRKRHSKRHNSDL